MQWLCRSLAGHFTQFLVQLELENVANEIANVWCVGGDVVFCTSIKVLLISAEWGGYAL